MLKGKTVWGFYAVCLVDRKATIWYRDKTCFLFVREGIFRAPANFPSSYFQTFVWILVDSDEDKIIPSDDIWYTTLCYIRHLLDAEDCSYSYDNHEPLDSKGD
jgi:hypothetical protein